ncbi:hypothetical protein ACH4T9_19870 [Micromonospora sp. NPDC020750]|uniref:hypothetical protein n=1 Tax=unclassified Micromonospora TaxID=2617518 RepID=UPI0037A53D47
MTVKISAQLTRAQREFNGLDYITDVLVGQPRGTRYAVVAYEVKRVTDEIGEGVEIPTIQITHVEPVDGVQADRVREILAERYQDRTGKSLEGDPTLFDVAPGDGGPGGDEEQVPEASADELMARRAERKAAGQPAFSDGGEPL